MSGRDNIDINRRQMEGPDPARPFAGNQEIRRMKKIDRECISKGFDSEAARYGGERTGTQRGLCGGSAQGRIFVDGTGAKSEANS